MEKIKTDDLRRMDQQEGLILQGCGGDPQEWLDGINKLLTQAGILKESSRFEKAVLFQHDGLTNILFPFDGVDLDVGKLAMWRLQTHQQFGGTWLSDYVPNRLGGFLSSRSERPRMKLAGHDGNIFSILGRASCVLRQAKQKEQASEMTSRVFDAHSYEEALGIISEYVDTEITHKQKKKARDANER